MAFPVGLEKLCNVFEDSKSPNKTAKVYWSCKDQVPHRPQKDQKHPKGCFCFGHHDTILPND